MSGVAVSETAVPSVKKLVHAPEGQEIPDGDDATEPFPLTLTVSLCEFAGALKVAVTAALGWAVSVTVAPGLNALEQAPARQRMPDGAVLTLPSPSAVTVSVCVEVPLPPQAASRTAVQKVLRMADQTPRGTKSFRK